MDRAAEKNLREQMRDLKREEVEIEGEENWREKKRKRKRKRSNSNNEIASTRILTKPCLFPPSFGQVSRRYSEGS